MSLEGRIKELEEQNRRFENFFDEVIETFEGLSNIQEVLSDLKKMSLLLQKESSRVVFQLMTALFGLVEKQRRQQIRRITEYIS